MKKLTALFLTVAIISVATVPAFANEYALLNNAEQAIYIVENELALDNTNVIAELNEMKERLISLKTSLYDLEEIGKVDAQICTLDDMIDEYIAYENGSLVIPYGSFHIVYSPAVSSIVAYFNSQDYYLAAELLTHAKNNDMTDSFYSPTYGYLVKQTTAYSNVYNNGGISGSASFNKTGRTVDDDFYYAIHSFNYYKDTTHRTLEFNDRYDYAVADYSSIQGIAVNTMYNAQQAGVIVPFRLTISVSY